MIAGIRINIRPEQMFEFNEQVKTIMYELLHQESFNIVSENMVDFLIENDSSLGYRQAIRYAIDNKGGRGFNRILMHLDIIKPQHHTEYLLGSAISVGKQLRLTELNKKLRELPEVQDWSVFDSLPSDERERRLKDWNHTSYNPVAGIPHQSVRYVLPFEHLYLPFYAETHYTDTDWEQFWKETFEDKRIFVAAVHNALLKYTEDKDLSYLPFKNNDELLNKEIQKLYIEHPEYVEIPEFNIDLRDTYERFPVVNHNIPKKWLEETLETWKSCKL